MNNSSYKLLAKDLAGRIPYGVKCQINIGDGDYYVDTLYYVTLDECVYFLSDKDETEYVLEQCDVKPYLFPLSSMTEEQAKELFDIVGLECSLSKEDYFPNNEVTSITFFLQNGFDVETHLDKLLDLLNRNHFDWRCLIPMGLAIDATNLNIY